MVKVVILLTIFACVAIGTFAAPVDEEPLNDDHVIAKRATCDLLSFEVAGVKVNDAACAAHCLALKRRGGHCSSNGVCYCRK